MAANQNGDGPQATHARQKLSELREIIKEAKASDDAERTRLALVEVVDGLITQAENQARALDDIRSDLSHKQGIVTRIGGGDY